MPYSLFQAGGLWGRHCAWQLGHKYVQFRKLPCPDYSLCPKGKSPFVYSLTVAQASKGHASLQDGLMV